jgi:hypothetical protein
MKIRRRKEGRMKREEKWRETEESGTRAGQAN